MTVPEITTATALGIFTDIADRVPALGDARGWHARFGRELNATDDRPHFVPYSGAPAVLPVIEGKQLSPFHVDAGASRFAIDRRTAASLLDRIQFERERIAYRDVASATNKLTLIAAMLPRGAVSTHTLFCLKSPLDERDQWCLLALMNSLVANYVVRLQVTTHVTTSLMTRLPVPRPATGSRDSERLADLAQHIASMPTTAFAGEASAAYAELNAIAARLYSLPLGHYEHIVNTFPLLPAALRDQCVSTYETTELARRRAF